MVRLSFEAGMLFPSIKFLLTDQSNSRRAFLMGLGSSGVGALCTTLGLVRWHEDLLISFQSIWPVLSSPALLQAVIIYVAFSSESLIFISSESYKVMYQLDWCQFRFLPFCAITCHLSTLSVSSSKILQGQTAQ